MGNEAIARGALEAGRAGRRRLSRHPFFGDHRNAFPVLPTPGKLYVEWSTNEKVALEVAAAASFAGSAPSAS